MRNSPNQLGNNMFIINCKNYNEIAGEKIIKIAKTAEKISRKYKPQLLQRTVKLSILFLQNDSDPGHGMNFESNL